MWHPCSNELTHKYRHFATKQTKVLDPDAIVFGMGFKLLKIKIKCVHHLHRLHNWQHYYTDQYRRWWMSIPYLWHLKTRIFLQVLQMLTHVAFKFNVYTAKLLFHQPLCCTVTTLWQHGDYTATGSSVTALPAVINGDYTVTVQSQCSHSAA